jgi:hypothetical protein
MKPHETAIMEQLENAQSWEITSALYVQIAEPFLGLGIVYRRHGLSNFDITGQVEMLIGAGRVRRK